MWEKIFKTLFKFTPVQYAEGEIVFRWGVSFIIFLVVLVLLCIGLVVIYKKSHVYPSRRTFIVSLLLRLLAVALLCLPLLEPVLLVPDIIPKENFLVILADKSASMSIKDGYLGQTRDDDVRLLLLDNKDGMMPELNENFKIRTYAFGGVADRVDSLASRTPEERTTNISSALKRIAADFKGLPLTGIVMLTDGCDNSLDDPYDIVKELRSLNIPLHVIGLGAESFDHERELLDVVTSKGLEEGSGAEIDVKVRSWKEETDPVVFNIYRGVRKVFSENRILKGHGKVDYFTFFYEPEEKGAIEYSIQMDRLPEEINTENNSQNMLIDTQKDTIRVLYFEGQLRSDFKFIKRALEGDPVFEFTSVSRTGVDKFYRQGLQSPDELVKGFAVTEEELYRFKSVIFGDIEASYFTIEQLNMIERFVRERGGGFLMLGGINSFSESEYWNTPIADILPVEIDPVRKMDIQRNPFGQTVLGENGGFKFVPTMAGLESPILKLASERSTNRAIWNEMPILTSINFFGDVKPGATVLAEKPKDRFGGNEPLLVIQRYGRGRSAALGTSSTWRWKLMVDSENNRHERFWRQMGRWLVASALDNVNITIADNVVETGEQVPIRVNVFDSNYDPIPFIDVKGVVSDPSGQRAEMVFHPELTQEGEYVSEFVPGSRGVFEIDVVANKDGRVIGSDRQSILARSSKKEFYDATLKRDFLETLAGESGGLYYDPVNAAEIPFNLRTRKSETSIMRTKYLWDMPFIYLIIIILLAGEWVYRRRRGLA